jgi:hypothetical protein
MPRGGRYRAWRVATWAAPDFQALTPQAKLVLLALSTGSLSNLAGLAFYYPAALERETGLTADVIEAALGELEKRPSPARSFVVRDLGVVWIRDLLRADPAREGDPEIKNPQHRTAIENILASLPRDSMAVKKFRDSYHFRSHTPSHRPPRRATQGARQGAWLSPDTGEQRTESGTGTRARETPGPPCRPEAPAGQGDQGQGTRGRTKGELTRIGNIVLGPPPTLEEDQARLEAFTRKSHEDSR